MIAAFEKTVNDDTGVDTSDLEEFEYCATARRVHLLPGYEGTDFDEDNDVDRSNSGVFQRCYSGTGKPADPNCAS
ncbi:MAG: hypothetical protein KA354_24085 [Phycisphaerae bacterium]|nr:hypothetical protein [Phycisphaerae bacterium]